MDRNSNGGLFLLLQMCIFQPFFLLGISLGLGEGKLHCEAQLKIPYFHLHTTPTEQALNYTYWNNEYLGRICNDSMHILWVSTVINSFVFKVPNQ